MDGYVTIGTKLDTGGFEKDFAKLGKSLERNTTQMSNTMLKTFKFLKASIIGLAIGYAIKKSFEGLDDAISRVDTLNNFPKVMANLGISSADAQESIDYLSEKLKGLPTTLDSAVSSVQRLTSKNGNVKASAEMFLALNNAVLAGGAPMQQQAMAIEQISQAYSRGKPDMMEWRSMMTSMPAQLKQVAIAMGYVNADQLGEALRNGQVSMDEFMKTLIKLNKEGINGFTSLEEQARTGTGGIQTSITNLKTTITRGLASIMDAIGQSNIAGFFQGIAKAIDKVIPYVVAFVKVIMTAVSLIAGLFGKKIQTDSKKVKDNIGGAGASMGALSDSTDDVNKGLGGATKKAKELKKQLAGFDEMNVLQDNTTSSGGSGGSSGGASAGGVGDFDLSGIDFEIDKVGNKTEEIYNKMMSIFGRIGEVMKSIWNSEPVQAFVNTAMIYGEFLWNYYKTLALNLLNNMTTTWDNIKENVGITLSNLTELWTLFWQDLGVGIETWGQPIINSVNSLFNSIWTDAIDPAIQLIAQGWADFSGILLKLWKEHGKPLVDNIGQFVATTIVLFKKIWDDIISPIVTPFLETLSWLWDNHIKQMVDAVGDFVATLIEDALIIYNKFIAPLVSILLDVFAPAWSFISSHVIGVLGTIIGFLADVATRFLKILTGIIDFITGVFTGNWKKAWNGVKSIFSGIVGGLASIFKLPINLIIDGINAFISGLNKIKIPSWVPAVGGKGFHINKIPKLASGGIVNNPGSGVMMGNYIAGEKGPEAVIPLDDNTMNRLGQSIASHMVINANIVNTMNGRVISRELKIIQNENDFAYNR